MEQSEYFLFAIIALFLASAVIPIVYMMIMEASTRRVYERTLDDDDQKRLASFCSIGLPWREFRSDHERRHRNDESERLLLERVAPVRAPRRGISR